MYNSSNLNTDAMGETKFFCANCGHKLCADNDMCGMKVECPACGNTITVPGGQTSKKQSENTDYSPIGFACPTCGAQDYALCPNCGKDTEWHLEENGVKCSCGTFFTFCQCACCGSPVPRQWMFHTSEDAFNKDIEARDQQAQKERGQAIMVAVCCFLLVGGLIVLGLIIDGGRSAGSSKGDTAIKGDIVITCPKCGKHVHTYTTCGNCDIMHSFVKKTDYSYPMCTKCKATFYDDYSHGECLVTIRGNDSDHVRIE